MRELRDFLIERKVLGAFCKYMLDPDTAQGLNASANKNCNFVISTFIVFSRTKEGTEFWWELHQSFRDRTREFGVYDKLIETSHVSRELLVKKWKTEMVLKAIKGFR